MGVRHANGARGDLIAEVQIMLPQSADSTTIARLLEAAKAAEAVSESEATENATLNSRALLRW